MAEDSILFRHYDFVHNEQALGRGAKVTTNYVLEFSKNLVQFEVLDKS